MPSSINFSDASLGDLLKPGGYDCACGRHHETSLAYLRIGSGVINTIPDALAALGKRRPFVVCDANTYKAAGERVVGMLRSHNIPYGLFVFPKRADKIEPDEHAVGALAMAYDPSCDIVLAVGSGVINDCCKALAKACGVLSMVVGTAPSMDGYASDSSSMVVNRIKTTLYNDCPHAVICDTDIMSKAPMEMLLAGLGDMLAKSIAQFEWRMAHIITGEYHCDNVAGLMRRSLKKCVDASGGLAIRDPAAVAAVVEGLTLSGIAMSFAKISRPASGLEHYFSHVWEMVALNRGEASALHGTQVGVGTLLTLRLLEHISRVTPSREHALSRMARLNRDAWEERVRRVFGPTADAIIESVDNEGYQLDPQKHAERLDRIIDNWQTILTIMKEELPSADDIEALTRRTRMPVTPADIGISVQDTRDAFFGSRIVRPKYLSSSLIWDMGYEDECEALLPGLAV